MGGNESDMRQKADARLKEARSNGSSAEQISQLQTARDIVRDTELSKTGGNRQAGER